jgi:hypothetical protein
VAINIGTVTRILPVIGVTLPDQLRRLKRTALQERPPD